MCLSVKHVFAAVACFCMFMCGYMLLVALSLVFLQASASHIIVFAFHVIHWLCCSQCSAILNVELEIVQANSCRYDSWVRNCYYIIFIRCPLYKYVYKGHNMELFSKRRFASSYINKKLNQLLYPTNTLKQPRSFSSTYLT